MTTDRQSIFLKTRRAINNLTQYQVAEMLNISEKTYRNWENGSSKIYIEKLPQLCEILKISIDEFYACRKLSEEEKEIVNIVCDNVNEEKREEKKKIKIKLLSIILFLIIFFSGIILYLFVQNNYDNCYVYSILSDDDSFKVVGELVITPEKEIISINEVDIGGTFFMEQAYVIDYGLYMNDRMVVQINGIEHSEIFDNDKTIDLEKLIFNQVRFYVKENTNYNESMDLLDQEMNLVIKIKYLDINKEIQSFEIPLKVEKEYSNNKFFYFGGENI